MVFFFIIIHVGCVILAPILLVNFLTLPDALQIYLLIKTCYVVVMCNTLTQLLVLVVLLVFIVYVNVF